MNEPLNAHCDGMYAITYRYDPAKHGKNLTITLSFMGREGRRDTHHYETIHGKRWLRRLDPK